MLSFLSTDMCNFTHEAGTRFEVFWQSWHTAVAILGVSIMKQRHRCDSDDVEHSELIIIICMEKPHGLIDIP